MGAINAMTDTIINKFKIDNDILRQELKGLLGKLADNLNNKKFPTRVTSLINLL